MEYAFARSKEERWLENSRLVKSIVNEYDGVGDLIGIDDGVATFSYEYDTMRREVKSTMNFSGLKKGIVLRSEYDKRSQRTLAESDNFSTRYTYTPARQVESIVSGEQSVAYAYDVAERRIDISSGKKTVLTAVVSNHPGYDWELVIRINETVQKTVVVDDTLTQRGWAEVSLDLTPFAGRNVLIELENKANGWSFEAGYWANLNIESSD